MKHNDNIIALATPSGNGAIAVIRISGPDAISIVSKNFSTSSKKKLTDCDSHTVNLGHIIDNGVILDEALASIFKNPRSYTGENVVEISCHGSHYIQQEIIQLFLRNGCRMAHAGEFTLRAFLNGKMDLSQAEAVADLIASDTAASHQLAMQQMRGGFSSEISKLRQELLNFASLIELELDFAEEDVEFANRTEFEALIDRIIKVLKALIDSFAVGNVIKNGIPVAIVGEPNVGKSTLLNAILKEEKAIVSEIAGTTRDSIEDEISIGGIGFRFIDTAGIRETDDKVESIGIKRTFEKIKQAQVVIYMVDAPSVLRTSPPKEENKLGLINEIERIRNRHPNKNIITIVNKSDLVKVDEIENLKSKTRLQDEQVPNLISISAKTGEGIEELTNKLLDFVNTGALQNNQTIVTNSRHYDALEKALQEILQVKLGLEENKSGDLLAIDIRQALYHFGEITGEITNDDLLGNIFANFCIGK